MANRACRLDGRGGASYAPDMVAYVDCEGCGCLIRAEEQRCPFCDRHPTIVWHAGLKMLGLTLGLSLANASCAADEMPSDTIADADDDADGDDADAVTYAGPDDASFSDSGTFTTTVSDPTDTSSDDTTTSTTSTTYDPTDADAVTYAGPDESTSLIPEESSSGTDSGTDGTDDTTTDTSGSGASTDPNG